MWVCYGVPSCHIETATPSAPAPRSDTNRTHAVLRYEQRRGALEPPLGEGAARTVLPNADSGIDALLVFGGQDAIGICILAIEITPYILVSYNRSIISRACNVWWALCRVCQPRTLTRPAPQVHKILHTAAVARLLYCFSIRNDLRARCG